MDKWVVLVVFEVGNDGVWIHVEVDIVCGCRLVSVGGVSWRIIVVS